MHIGDLRPSSCGGWIGFVYSIYTKLFENGSALSILKTLKEQLASLATSGPLSSSRNTCQISSHGSSENDGGVSERRVAPWRARNKW